jgi:NTE family protein
MHFGDGCLRNTAPLSPAIHMGADQILVVSVRRPDSVVPAADMTKIEPSFARVLGVVLNALMLDAIELDMERMIRVNSTLQHISPSVRTQLKLRPMNWFWVRPSVDIGHLAADNFDRLPKVIKYLIGGLGSSREASEITSYLLFDPEFLTALVDIGYRDVLAMKEHVVAFLSGQRTPQNIQL